MPHPNLSPREAAEDRELDMRDVPQQSRSAAPYVAPGFRYEFHIGDPSAAYFWSKRLIDVLVSAVALVFTLPLMVSIALAVLATGRPIFFRQVRAGEGGRAITVLKFRTLRNDADAYAAKPDDRAAYVTSVGRVLRRLGLDELPQLWNVLRGDMSLVGPRPEMPFLVQGYDALRNLRLSARPGVTGLWQLSPVRKLPIHDFIEYDLFYLAHRTLRFDLWIMLRTPLLLLLGRHVELNRDLVRKWGGDSRGSPVKAKISIDLSADVARLEEPLSVVTSELAR